MWEQIYIFQMFRKLQDIHLMIFRSMRMKLQFMVGDKKNLDIFLNFLTKMDRYFINQTKMKLQLPEQKERDISHCTLIIQMLEIRQVLIRAHICTFILFQKILTWNMHFKYHICPKQQTCVFQLDYMRSAM